MVSTEDFNPIFIAAEFHYKFIRIHPFDDGNGRTARILMNFILMQFKFPPVIIKTEDKENYFSALRLADSGNIKPFINYIAKNLIRSLKIMIAGATGESIEEVDDFDKEIALLEQKFRSLSNQENISKSKENVLKIFDESIEEVFKRFLASSKRFDKFYVSGELLLHIPNWAKHGNYEIYLEVREKISEFTEFIELRYDYKTFKMPGGEFDYTSLIRFEFGLFDYVLKNLGNEISYTKRYGDALTTEEIELLLQNEAVKHKNMIENKLKNLI